MSEGWWYIGLQTFAETGLAVLVPALPGFQGQPLQRSSLLRVLEKGVRMLRVAYADLAEFLRTVAIRCLRLVSTREPGSRETRESCPKTRISKSAVFMLAI